MQIVLSGNRVIAYGDNCFLAMGGTVICEETGKAYSNATVAEVDVLPADIDRVGYEYHAGVFVPCAPYGMDNGNGTILVACEECGTPKDSGLRIDEIIGARLKVTAPAGCEVICTNGDKTVKGIYKNGVYVCNLTDYGEWTATAGRWHGLIHESNSDAVTVDIVKQYALALGASISVEYPAGSTVTCTHGDIVLTAPDTSGVWELDVLAFGEWELYCTNGEKEASRKFTVTEGGQTESIKLAYFAADIVVTYPANSTCTCSDGTTTFTDTNSTDAEKTVTFTVPNAATWTVTATDGTETASKTVEITTEGQSVSVELDYRLWLYKRGNEYTETTGGWNATKTISSWPQGTSTKQADCLFADSNWNGSSGNTAGWTTKNNIDVSKYKTLKVLLTSTSSSYNSIGISSSDYRPDKAVAENLVGENLEVAVDISTIDGEYKVHIGAWSGSDLSIYEVWLE